MSAVGCDSEQQRRDRVHGSIYFRDAEGRCLRLNLGVYVGGSQFAQSGVLDVFVVRTEPCGPHAEDAQ